MEVWHCGGLDHGLEGKGDRMIYMVFEFGKDAVEDSGEYQAPGVKIRTVWPLLILLL